METGHFRELERELTTIDRQRSAADLREEHLALRYWTVAAGAPTVTPLDEYAECFVVPLAGELALADGTGWQALAPQMLAYLPDTRQTPGVRAAESRFVVVGWPRTADHDVIAGAGGESRAPRIYHFAEALVPSAPGWRFFSVDGAYLTVGCSYREAPPPARERPHSHDGEQINLPLEGRFAFTVADQTTTIAPGWAALTPRGVLHTGLHVEFPYFQLIFATPPRGRNYAEFLRSIYRGEPTAERST